MRPGAPRPTTVTAVVRAAALGLLLVQSASALSTPYNQPITGDGTYYGATTGGNCGLNNPVPAMYANMVPVAMNKQQYENSAICGACLTVTGSGSGAGANPITGTFAAYVSDQCPECAYGAIDLAKNGDGRWKVSWQLVPCPNVAASDIAFAFQGSNKYYYKVQPRQMRSPATRVTIGGLEATRSSDNFFVTQNGAGFPNTVEIEVWTVLGDHYVSAVTGYTGVIKGTPATGGSAAATTPAPSTPSVSTARPTTTTTTAAASTMVSTVQTSSTTTKKPSTSTASSVESTKTTTTTPTTTSTIMPESTTAGTSTATTEGTLPSSPDKPSATTPTPPSVGTTVSVPVTTSSVASRSTRRTRKRTTTTRTTTTTSKRRVWNRWSWSTGPSSTSKSPARYPSFNGEAHKAGSLGDGHDDSDSLRSSPWSDEPVGNSGSYKGRSWW